ncbi:hypothetical protein BJ165DRAFT_1462165 [Panaeolus papilionaceus]|nr:hypothetical protein BJ165DRAFT_1462165 [Panaeolus papilionaceus]
MHSRPTLPLRYANPHIKDHLNASNLPPVKYQILNCQGKDILVGRLKIETPENGHAFILRRFDTGAVSLTTMYRAAFPLASDTEEKAEIQWVKETFELAGNNGSSKEPHITRLAGTWVSPATALQLGKEYALGELINVVVEAQPDPTGSYRRSGKSANSTTTYTGPIATPYIVPKAEEVAPPVNTVVSKPPSRTSPVKPPSSAAKTLPTPSPTSPSKPPVSKRRRESSPAPTSESSKPPSRASPAPVRRSARTKSPAPPKSVAPLSSLTKTPRTTRSSKKEVITATPGGSELTIVEEEHQIIEEGMMGTLRDEDIKEQQTLIQHLKAKRESAKQELVKEMEVEESSNSQKKRDREEEEAPLQFQFKEPEVEERAIATNRRVGRFHMEPRTKSFAWGVAAFAIGMGAVTYLPNFF